MFPKLFIIFNHDSLYFSHRKEFVVAAFNYGWGRTIMTCNTGCFHDIRALKLKAIYLPINATRMILKEEWKKFSFLKKLYKDERPEVIHQVGLKTILWDSLAAKLTKVKGVVNTMRDFAFN